LLRLVLNLYLFSGVKFQSKTSGIFLERR